MATIGDTLTAILQDLGVVASGATPAGADSALALLRANEWVDGLANENLTVYTITRTTWALTAATSYAVGTGSAVNIVRPVNAQSIRNIGYQDTSISPSLERGLGPCLTEDAYAALPQKSLAGVYPLYWYYNPTFPTGTLRPFPVPTSATLQGVIYTDTALTQFTALTDSLSLPPGYKRFFRTNLAAEIAPAFNVTPSASLLESARDSKADIKRTNIRLRDLSLDRGALMGNSNQLYDINQG